MHVIICESHNFYYRAQQRSCFVLFLTCRDWGLGTGDCLGSGEWGLLGTDNDRTENENIYHNLESCCCSVGSSDLQKSFHISNLDLFYFYPSKLPQLFLRGIIIQNRDYRCLGTFL